MLHVLKKNEMGPLLFGGDLAVAAWRVRALLKLNVHEDVINRPHLCNSNKRGATTFTEIRHQLFTHQPDPWDFFGIFIPDFLEKWDWDFFPSDGKSHIRVCETNERECLL